MLHAQLYNVTVQGIVCVMIVVIVVSGQLFHEGQISSLDSEENTAEESWCQVSGFLLSELISTLPAGCEVH